MSKVNTAVGANKRPTRAAPTAAQPDAAERREVLARIAALTAAAESDDAMRIHFLEEQKILNGKLQDTQRQLEESRADLRAREAERDEAAAAYEVESLAFEDRLRSLLQNGAEQSANYFISVRDKTSALETTFIDVANAADGA